MSLEVRALQRHTPQRAACGQRLKHRAVKGAAGEGDGSQGNHYACRERSCRAVQVAVALVHLEL